MARKPWVIVGAGFTGSTVARALAERGESPIIVIDRRDHIAGNAFDERETAGIMVHRHGPHIFHTNSERIWDFLSRFTRWRSYEHRVLADLDGTRVPIPFNFDSIRITFGRDRAERMIDGLIAEYGAGQKVPLFKMLSSERTSSSELAEYVYQQVFLNYTTKQWGLRPEELDRSVTNRVPILLSNDDRYFDDKFQAMPLGGYSALVSAMLHHPAIEIQTSTDYSQLSSALASAPTVFTGAIDEYFGYLHGALRYRSLRFEVETYPIEKFQPVGTVNYPNVADFTRITEFKHLTGDTGSFTTVSKEFPIPHRVGETEAYYPIPSAASAAVLAKYREEISRTKQPVWFAGRLGDYAYYNMDQAVGRGLSLVEKELSLGANQLDPSNRLSVTRHCKATRTIAAFLEHLRNGSVEWGNRRSRSIAPTGGRAKISRS